jgi:hypothetical protein
VSHFDRAILLLPPKMRLHPDRCAKTLTIGINHVKELQDATCWGIDHLFCAGDTVNVLRSDEATVSNGDMTDQVAIMSGLREQVLHLPFLNTRGWVDGLYLTVQHRAVMLPHSCTFYPHAHIILMCTFVCGYSLFGMCLDYLSSFVLAADRKDWEMPRALFACSSNGTRSRT